MRCMIGCMMGCMIGCMIGGMIGCMIAWLSRDWPHVNFAMATCQHMNVAGLIALRRAYGTQGIKCNDCADLGSRLMLRRPSLDAMPNSMRSKSSSSLSSNIQSIGCAVVLVLFVVVVCVDCSMVGLGCRCN